MCKHQKLSFLQLLCCKPISLFLFLLVSLTIVDSRYISLIPASATKHFVLSSCQFILFVRLTVLKACSCLLSLLVFRCIVVLSSLARSVRQPSCYSQSILHYPAILQFRERKELRLKASLHITASLYPLLSIHCQKFCKPGHSAKPHNIQTYLCSRQA